MTEQLSLTNHVHNVSGVSQKEAWLGFGVSGTHSSADMYGLRVSCQQSPGLLMTI